ncbi:MAG TPA: serine protease, partial [Flavobacteriaceae bacterium]|nr:serine protease [Flavobacteriaceae bacterium]
NPAKVSVREITLAVMDKHMAKDNALKLKLASKHAGLANYWKFWIGESQGLKRFKAVEAKEAFEKEFTDKLNKNPEFKAKYAHVLPRMKELYAQKKPYVAVQSYASEIFGRNIDLPTITNISGMLIERSKTQGEAYYTAAKDRFKDYLLNSTLKEFDADTDKEVFGKLMDLYVKNVDEKYISKALAKALKNKTGSELAKEIYSVSNLTSKENIEALFAKKSLEDFTKTLEKDPAYQLFSAQQKLIDKEVSNPVNKINSEINDLMGKYMKAQMEVYSDKAFYPDANFTMRVAYGRVKGFEPRDGVFYEPRTHLSGVIEKYKPNDLEFDLPKGILDLYKAKDYGKYAAKNGKLVTNFLATNHITGGNSGSPILDKNGYHIGLAFDGVWEGVMEDVYYRPEIARSIHVKDNYVLFIIDKLSNSQHIMKELTIVKE